MGIFGAAHGWWREIPLPKICHTYPSMKNTLPKEDPNNIWITWHTCWVLLTSAFFHWKLANFVISRIQIAFWYIISNSFNFFSDSLKIFLIKLVIILMMSAKMATPGLLKITVFWNKGYDVIISVDDVTNKILWHDSNYIVDLFMWPKFGNSSISMREVITTSIL